MSRLKQKKFFLILAALIFLAGLALTADTLKNYDRIVPVIVGPYRKAIFIGLVFLFAAVMGFAFCSLNQRTISGTICIAMSVLWFIGEMIITDKMPDSYWLGLMKHWMPLPLVLFGIGTALWISCLIPIKRIGQISEKWQLILALLLMFIVLQPALNGGFNWDDAFFSVEAQFMRVSGESIWKRVWKEIVDYAVIGRINPFATFHFLVFYFIPGVRFYKLFLIGLTLLDGLLFYRFLRLWTREHAPAITALLATVLCFQFRLYHDPLNSYYGLMQVMFCELMGALIAWLHWAREGKKTSLVISLVLFGMGLMSYEMFFPFIALMLILAWSEVKNPAAAIRKILPWLILTLAIFSLSIFLRGNITEETAYNGTTFHIDFPAILKTFVTQTGSAFPISYRNAGYDTGLFGKLVGWDDIFNTSLPVFLRSIQWQDLLGCLIFALILRQLLDEKQKFSIFGLLFGLLLWLLPGLVISLSEKYQADLVPGLAYIPVFFSYFGAGMILYQLSALLEKMFHAHTVRLILGGAGCMLLLINLQDSRHINAMLDDIFFYPRKAGEEALQAGILGETPAETVISAVPYSLWEHGWALEPYQSKFYSLHTRKPTNAVGERDYVEFYRNEDVDPEWIIPSNTSLIYYSGDEAGGFAISGRVKGTGFDFENNRLQNTMVSELFVYVSGKYQKGTILMYETRDAEWKQLPLDEAWLVRREDTGTLYKIQERIPIVYNTIGLRYY